MRQITAILTIFAVLVSLAAFFIFKKPGNPQMHLKKMSFAQLPGWQKGDVEQSLKAFKISCKAFLKHNPEKSVGSQFIDIKAKDWHPACKAAINVASNSQSQARKFFQTWFTPVVFHRNKAVSGLFTGYYMPTLKGSLHKTKQFDTPIYGLPSDLITADLRLFDSKISSLKLLRGQLHGKKLIPYYTREQISKGAIKKSAPVLAWTDSRVERHFLEIEGSGALELENGEKIFLGYAGQNGAPYTALAKVLIDKGVMTRDNASMQKIKTYFKEHPEEVSSILNQNQSFVFFTRLPHQDALGSQGVALTPGYSLAVDRSWVPMGTPLWLNSTRPAKENDAALFQRLMIAQDTGGAIRGPVRGDVYWGSGEDASYIAGHMKNKGHYWLLLPNTIFERLKAKLIL